MKNETIIGDSNEITIKETTINERIGIEICVKNGNVTVFKIPEITGITIHEREIMIEGTKGRILIGEHTISTYENMVYTGISYETRFKDIKQVLEEWKNER